MTTSLLLLRLRIIRRLAAELPRTEPFATVVILAMLGVAQWRLFAWTGDATGRWLVAACSVAVLLSVHTARRDERFLRIAGVAHRRLFAVEYLLLCLPFSVPLLFSAGPHLAAVGPGGALLLSLVPTGLTSHVLESLTRSCDRIHLLASGAVAGTFQPGEFDRLDALLLSGATGEKLDLAHRLIERPEARR